MKPALRPIEIDLRRDLPKVLAMKADLLRRIGTCQYTAPCVIGAMMSPEDRNYLASIGRNSQSCRSLFADGFLSAPAEQHNTLRSLQRLFDDGLEDVLCQTLDRLAAKYLSSEEQSS